MDIVLSAVPNRIFAAIILLVLLRPVIAEDAIPVSVAPITAVSIAEEVKLTGNLLAKRTSLLSSEVEGIVKGIYVDDGSKVTQAQTLVDLDTDIAAINKNTAAAALAQADATLAESKRRHGELAELKSQSHASKTSVATALAQISIDKAARARAASEFNRASTLLKKHTITAPFSGVINRKLVEIGQWVSTGTPLVELVDTRLLRLEIPVPQYYFSSVNEKSPVQIRFDARPNQIIESTVSAIIPISSDASRTFRIRLDIPNDDQQLAPGMTAKTTLRLGSSDQEKSLIAPRDAIIRKPGDKHSLWIVEDIDGIEKVREIDISIGRSYRDGVEILGDNVPSGSLTVVRGNEILRPGQSVTIANELSAEY